MINFVLNSSDYTEISDLNIMFIFNINQVNTTSEDIEKLIHFFNEEYHWDDMFNFKDVQDRIENGHYLFLLYYNHKPIGYVFYEPKENDEFYLYNLYVTNRHKRPSFSPIWFVNKTIGLLPKSFKKVTCVCEDWHTSAHNVFKLNEFKLDT